MTAELLTFFEDLASSVQAALKQSPPGQRARKLMTLQTARLGVRLYSGREPLVWGGVLTPFDLLSAMGLTSCYVEFVGALVASTGASGAVVQSSEQAGYSTDCCTYHRAVSGAVQQGLVPEPLFLVPTTCPCTGGQAVIESLAHHFGRPLFLLHIPLGRDEKAVSYLAAQLRALTGFVAGQTGRPLDPQRLRQAMELTNRTRAALAELFQLIRAVPTPARRRDMINMGIVLPLYLGTEAGLQIAETYRDEMRLKIKNGTPGVPGERVRLLWLQNRVQFRSPIEELLQEQGAAVVADELNIINWDPIDPDDPYPGLARRALSISLHGSVDWRLQVLQRMARDYQVDGALNPCHWGCRQGTGARGLIEQGLRSIGVPVLNLEVDCVDNRNFAEGQIRTRLLAFIEMLAERRARGERAMGG